MAEAIDILLKLKDLYDAVKSRIDAFKDNKTESSNLMERLGFFVVRNSFP